VVGGAYVLSVRGGEREGRGMWEEEEMCIIFVSALKGVSVGPMSGPMYAWGRIHRMLLRIHAKDIWEGIWSLGLQNMIYHTYYFCKFDVDIPNLGR
jgi:hypothetical protein